MTQESSIGHMPAKPGWEFDESVTKVFDDMLSRSIPSYKEMRKIITDLAMLYVKPGTDVVDMGCSRGEAMAPLLGQFGAQCVFYGLEVSAPMRAAAEERFAGYIRTGVAKILNYDLRLGFPSVRASVILSVLTLQFTPIEHRLRILQDVYDSLVPGGAFLLVEKIIGATARLDRQLVKLYYDFKAESGYSRDEIERKRLSLEGVLVPLTAKYNEDLLRGAGFTDVDCVWRSLNFAAWIAVKR